MDKPPKYNQWTKEALVRRVERLEEELRRAAAASGSAERPRSPPPAGGAPRKKRKTIDPARYSTRYIALKLAYLGKNYNGFEYQASGTQSTIEEELWKGLVKACLIFPERPDEVDWACCEYSKCGRTDRGVSAFGQVVGLRVRSNKPVRRKKVEAATAAAAADGGGEGERAAAGAAAGAAAPEEAAGQNAGDEAGEEALGEEEDGAPYPVQDELAYCRVLNSVLPPDIRVYAWCPAPPPGFSARFSCRERQYRYFFTQPALPPVPGALERGGAGGAAPGGPKEGFLDIDAMRRAAKLFEGLHDFRNFCKVDASKQITNFARRVFEADIVEASDLDTALPYLSRPEFLGAGAPPGGPKVYYFHVRGSAFLWHQIRHMVAVLFLVGQGLEPPEVVAELLDVGRRPRKPNYALAEDTPLVLWDCLFGRALGDGGGDELDWLYVGADDPLALYGTKSSLGDQLWGVWRERKMDEVLANRLLDWVTTRTDVARITAGPAAAAAARKRSASRRLFEGGDAARYAGAYVPLLRRPLLPSPEEVNDKWAQRKGFANAEEMRSRGNGNWREAMRAAKAGGADAEADE